MRSESNIADSFLPVPLAERGARTTLILIHPDPGAADAVRSAFAAAGWGGAARLAVHQADRLGLADPERIREADVILVDADARRDGPVEIMERARALGIAAPVIGLVSPARWRDAGRLLAGGLDDVVIMEVADASAVPEVVRRTRASEFLRIENRRLHEDLTRTVVDLELNNAELERLVSRLEASSRTDPLTGVANRRWLDANLAGAWAESEGLRRDAGHTGDLGFVMIDLDGFKRLNDTDGHQAGDDVLVATANVIRGVVGERGLVARCGGDEFCILLPGTGPGPAIELGESLLHAYRARTASWSGAASRVAMSIGVSHRHLSAPEDASALARHADEAMYAAKSHHGGDALVVRRGDGCERAPELPIAG